MPDAGPFLPAITQVGTMPARLPAGAERRARLMRLARRGSEVCHKWHAPLLAIICDGLVAALTDLAVAEYRAGLAERELKVARERIADLQGQLRGESFESETVKREMPDLLRQAR